MASAQLLRKAMELKRYRDDNPGISEIITDEIKSSLIFKHNCEELLSGAPVAFYCMASCFVAGGSSTAQRLDLNLPNSTTLRRSRLAPNLAECGELGMHAFLAAEKGMGGITNQSKMIDNKLSDLMETLSDPDAAKKMLLMHMKAIEKSADYCYNQAREIDQKFDAWLVHASDLYTACVSQDADDEDRLLATEIGKAVAQSRLTDSGAAVSLAKDALEKQLNILGEGYKKASSGFSDSWTILGQQVTTSFAEATSNLLTQFISTLVDGRSTGSNDPAYTSVTPDLNWFNLLHAILEGPDDSKQTAASSSISFIDSRLKDAVTSFRGIATNQEPSKEYLKALDAATKISSEILAKVNSGGLPDTKSDIFQQWQKEFGAAYDVALQLQAAAKTFPGSVKGTIPLHAETLDLDAKTEDAKSAQSQAVLKSAQDHLATIQTAYTANMETYEKSTALLSEQQKTLEAVKADLLGLTDSPMQFKEIKKVLVHSIKLIASLKGQIVKLIQFFYAMSKTIPIITNNCVTPFVNELKNNGSGSGSYNVGPYSYTDLQRSQIFNITLSIKAYFSVFADITSMWMAVSREHISPGVELCQMMSYAVDDPNQIKGRARHLDQFSENSLQAMKSFCQQKRAEVVEAMTDRIEDTKNKTKEVPPSSETAIKAIQTGVLEAKKATEASLEETNQKSPLRIMKS
ncbi:hypothetical protein TWF281_008495 [Arthrobotrys megalospora]